MKLSVIIPCNNEVKTIEEILRRVRAVHIFAGPSRFNPRDCSEDKKIAMGTLVKYRFMGWQGIVSAA